MNAQQSYIAEIKEFDDTQALKCLEAYLEEYNILELCRNKLKLDKMRFVDDRFISQHFLITGQSLVDFLLLHRFSPVFPEKLKRNIYVNDIDIFNLRHNVPDIHSDSNEAEFVINAGEVGSYGEISGTHYHVTSSLKINHFIKGDVVKVNYVDVMDNLFSEYQFKDHPDRMKYLSKNILGFFDLNVNQVGLYINIETNEMKLLYTKRFKNFVKSKQIELNPLNATTGRLARAFYKYQHLSKVDSSSRGVLFPCKNTKTDVFYLDENRVYKYLALIYGYFNKLVEMYCTKCDMKKIENAFNTAFRKMIVTRYGVIKPYFKFLYSRVLDKIEKTENIYNDEDLKVDTLVNIQFKEEFISDAQRFLDNVVIDPEIVFSRFHENFLDDIVDIKTFAENFILRDLATVALLESNLQMVSKKKLQNAVNYFIKKNKEHVLAELFLNVGKDFKILNKNVSDLLRVFSFIYLHSVFSRLFVNYYDTLTVFDFMIALLNNIQKYVQENYKELKLTKDELFNTLVGQIEQGIYKTMFIKYLDTKDLDEFNSVIDKMARSVIDKISKKLINFDPIVVNIDNYVAEELVRGIDLKNEGNFMSHCVGGYSTAVEKGNSIIIRIYQKGHEFDKERRETGFRYTCELAYNYSNTPKVIQIRGYRNKNVEDEHTEIVNQLISKFIDKLLEDSERVKFHMKASKDSNNALDRVFEIQPEPLNPNMHF